MDKQIIYENENLIALNKPAGVNFDWMLSPPLIPVHRLDKDTSGVILFAKRQETADYLKSLFWERKIKKTYLALVVGSLKRNRGIIDLPIGRSRKTPLKRVAIGEKRGKIREAITEFKVLKRFNPPAGKKPGFWAVSKPGFEEAGGFTLVEAYPKTGRTHQIRSHFAAIGHPIVCDKLYSGKKFVCPGNLKRQFLHASAVEFTLPEGGRIKLEADLPEDLYVILHFTFYIKCASIFACHH